MTTGIIVNVIESLVLVYFAVYGYRYCKGTINFTTKKEAIRQKRVEKYGSAISLVSALLLFFGFMIFILSIASFFIAE